MRLNEKQYRELFSKSLDYKINKYKNKKITIDNITFDSKKESLRYQQLKLLERAGVISNLELQKKYILQDKFELNGKKYREISYVADFVYIQDGKTIVEDTKGFRTEVYKLKKKMFMYKYKMEIKEI